MSTYTWKPCDVLAGHIRGVPANGWMTEEGQHDGAGQWIPDVIVFKDSPGVWFYKTRTSAMYSGPFETSKIAREKAEPLATS